MHTNRTHQPGPLLKSLLDHKLKLITSNKSAGVHTHRMPYAEDQRQDPPQFPQSSALVHSGCCHSPYLGWFLLGPKATSAELVLVEWAYIVGAPRGDLAVLPTSSIAACRPASQCLAGTEEGRLPQPSSRLHCSLRCADGYLESSGLGQGMNTHIVDIH